MPELLSSAQMRAIEQAAIAAGDVTGLELMERAGRGVVRAMFEEWPGLAPSAHKASGSRRPMSSGAPDGAAPRAVILCGPGNNGGDGFVIARLLHQGGWAVDLFLLDKAQALPPDAEEMRRRWDELGPTRGWTREGFQHLAQRIDPACPLLIVDALFGIGLSRPLGAEVTEVWDAFCDLASNLSTIGDLYLCAVDVPSGVSDAEPEGKPLTWFDDPATRRLTVTFHAPKLAHRAMLAAGERVRVVDIGLTGFAGGLE